MMYYETFARVIGVGWQFDVIMQSLEYIPGIDHLKEMVSKSIETASQTSSAAVVEDDSDYVTFDTSNEDHIQVDRKNLLQNT